MEKLVFVSDSEPGITRRRSGKGFSYRAPDGVIVGAAELARIKALAVPPAYRDVWICLRENGHLQATGRDARGRKQYRYHPLWQESRSLTKYDQLASFGAALPALRRRLRRDLQGEVGDQLFSLAALVVLLDRTWLRIGNAGYTAANRSFGASTLLSRHLSLNSDGRVTLRFRAKGGKMCQHTLRDKRLNKILQEIDDLPGRNLFTYIDEEGCTRCIHSNDVNSYLCEIAGEGMTAKTFRTWGGTLAAFEVASSLTAEERLTPGLMASAAAERLHNTATVCRKSYIHPAVLSLAELSAEDRAQRLQGLEVAQKQDLRRDEQRLLGYLSRFGS